MTWCIKDINFSEPRAVLSKAAREVSAAINSTNPSPCQSTTLLASILLLSTIIIITLQLCTRHFSIATATHIAFIHLKVSRMVPGYEVSWLDSVSMQTSAC